MPIDADLDDPNQDEDLISPNERRPQRLLDSRRQPDGELSDSEDEGEGGRRDRASHRNRDSSSQSSNGKHKFGMGIGIMASGSSNTHGAGPSGHTTAVRILSTSNTEDLKMEVDDTPPASAEELEPEATPETMTNGDSSMPVDSMPVDTLPPPLPPASDDADPAASIAS